MDQIEQNLRLGVKRIITLHTPKPDTSTVELNNFTASSHPIREVLFVVAGKSRYMFNNAVFDAVAGDCFLVNSWMTHAQGYRDCDCNLIHIWMRLETSDASAAIISIFDGKPEKMYQKMQLPQDLARTLLRRWDQLTMFKNIDDETISRSMLSPLNSILDEFAFQIFTGKMLSTRSIDKVIESVKNYILMHDGKNCTMDELEKISGYSKSYLAHCFKEHQGTAIGEFITDVRLNFTEAAIKRGLKQKEIAYELGFSSPANFWKFINKHRKKLPEFKKISAVDSKME